MCLPQTDLTGFAAATGGANRLLEALPGSAGWLLETILTFSLIFVIFIATDNKRAQSTAHLPMLAPAAIGFAVGPVFVLRERVVSRMWLGHLCGFVWHLLCCR